MATYHLSVKTTSRADGLNSVARASYRSGEAMTNERTGEVFDYKKKTGIVHSELFLGEGWEPEEREKLWNRIEQTEKRENSTVCREFEISLPLELNQEQRIEAAREFTQLLVERFGFAADLSIHEPDKHTRKPGADLSQENPHAHILTSTRNAKGQKCRELDEKKSGAIEEVRRSWEEICNKHLVKAGFTEKILSGKKLPLPERKLENENAMGKIDRQIRALENAIARLERRADEPDHRSRDNGPRKQDQGTEQLLLGRDPRSGPQKTGAVDDAHDKRSEQLPPLRVREYRQDENGNLSNSPASGRNDDWRREAQRRIDGIGSESAGLGEALREPFNQTLSPAIARLKEKLEALKAERNIKGMEEQNHDREQSGAVSANVQAHEARAACRAESQARAKERIAESRSSAHSQSRGPSSPQSAGGPASGPRFGM